MTGGDAGIGGGGGGTSADGGLGGVSGGGGAGQGGGAAAGRRRSRWGDGTTTVTIGPGTLVLDGGAAGNGDGVKLLDPTATWSQSGARRRSTSCGSPTTQGWVSKYDTRTGKGGRALSVIPKDCSNSAGLPCGRP